MSSEELNSYGDPLIGHQLVSVEKKDYSWFFRFSGEVSVATESAWRLINEDRIVVTSEDHGHQFGLPDPVDAASIVLSSIGGRKVEAAAISACSGDLTIEFNGCAQLQLLQMSGGYESWRLFVRDSETICTGGGEIAHFPRR
ncbi:MAG TPA: hypothetical protein VK747_04215 [Blastocatellia bacterium]|nr:hypothetical protein [Blastocatellia bacterium]